MSKSRERMSDYKISLMLTFPLSKWSKFMEGNRVNHELASINKLNSRIREENKPAKKA